MIHKKKPKIFSAVGVLELVTFSCLMHLFASSVWSWNELPSVSWGINQEDKGSDLPWPELQCPVDRRITRSFLNLPFPQYNHLGGGVKQPEQEATAAQRRFCSMGMRQGGGAVCQAVSRALLRHSEEMNFNAVWCHCSNFGEGISPRVDCWTYSVESSCWKPCSGSCLCVMWLLCVRASFCGAEQEPFSSERRSCVKAFWSRVRAASPGASSAARCQRDSITDLPATIPPWDE